MGEKGGRGGSQPLEYRSRGPGQGLFGRGEQKENRRWAGEDNGKDGGGKGYRNVGQVVEGKKEEVPLSGRVAKRWTATRRQQKE